MGSWLTKIQSTPWLKYTLMLAVLVAVGAGSFYGGKRQSGASSLRPIDPATGQPVGDYQDRVVAYLYGNKPVSRAELGEYLIERFGAERLEYLVNRKIVVMEADKYNIRVSDSEVEARFQRDLHSFNPPLTERDFVNSVLQRFKKTLYEWKEDVIRPKLMMEKLVEAKVQIKDADLQEGYEARYGPKVECRMIVCDKTDMSIVQKVWEACRKGASAFIEHANKQVIPNLAQTGGKVPPIHKHFGDVNLEKAAFALNEGEVSPLIELKDGTLVILLCEKKLPANLAVKFDDVRIKLAEEMKELRIAQRIPEEFQKMREEAKPWMVLNSAGQQQLVPTQFERPVQGSTVSHVKPEDPKNVPPAPVPSKVIPKVDMPAAPEAKSPGSTPVLPAPGPIAPLETKTPTETKSPEPKTAPTIPGVSPMIPNFSPPAVTPPTPTPATAPAPVVPMKQ